MKQSLVSLPSLSSLTSLRRVIAAGAVALFAFAAQASTYTWDSTKASGNWDDIANWLLDGEANVGYPNAASDIAVFAEGTTASVMLTKARTITRIDLSAANVKLMLKLADGAKRDTAKLSAAFTLGENADLTLDGVSVAWSGTPYMGSGSKLSIINGSAFSSGVAYNQASKHAAQADGGDIYIAGGSTVSMSGLHMRNGVFEIDDSTFTSQYGFRFCGDTSPSATTIRIKGKHPLIKMTGTSSEAYSCATGYNVHFEFVIPEGGFTETPIQGNSAVTLPSSRGTGTGTYAIDVAKDSPAILDGESRTETLINWPKGFLSGKINSFSMPYSFVSYAMGTSTFDVTLDGALVTAVPKIESSAWKGIDLSFAESTDATRELFVAYGAEDVGTDTTKWTIASLGTLATTATTYSYSFPAEGVTWGSDAFKFIRFYIVENGVKYWSNTTAWYTLAAPAFAAAPTAVDAGGDAITVTGEMSGYPGETCTLKVLTGKSGEGLTDEWAELDGSVLSASAESQTFSLAICETNAQTARLAPGTTYDVAVVATSAGTVTTSEVATVTTVATASATPKFMAKDRIVDRRTITFKGRMTALGFNGKADVTVLVGEMKDGSDFKQVGETKTVTTTESFSWDPITFEGFGKTYYYRLCATSTSAGGTVTTTPVLTQIGSFTTTDGTVTYEWTGAEDGNWTNKANWAPGSYQDDCVGYPSVATSTAKFDAGTTVELTLAADAMTGTLDFSAGGITVTLKKDANAETTPTLTVAASLNLNGTNNVFTVDGMNLSVLAGSETLGSNSTWKVVNGASVSSGSDNTKNNGGKILVEDATFTCTRYYMSLGALTYVKSVAGTATFTAMGRTQWNSTDAANPDTIRIEGANARYTMGWNDWAIFAPQKAGAILNLDFVIPRGGWTTNTVPLVVTSAPSADRPCGYLSDVGKVKVNLIQNEGDASSKTVTTPLINWPGPGIAREYFVLGDASKKSSRFIWKDADGVEVDETVTRPIQLWGELPGSAGFLLIIR